MKKQYNDAQIEETPTYITLVMEDLLGDYRMVQQELTQHKEDVVPLRVHQELKKNFDALTSTEDETFNQYKVEQKMVEKEQGQVTKG